MCVPYGADLFDFLGSGFNSRIFLLGVGSWRTGFQLLGGRVGRDLFAGGGGF